MLLFVDDMMQHQVQINAVYVSEGKYDYFSGIRSQAPTRICQIADNTILCSSAETTFALLCSILQDIQSAKVRQPDAIIICIHWEEEYQSLPNREQREPANWLLQQGITHTIGLPPHVI